MKRFFYVFQDFSMISYEVSGFNGDKYIIQSGSLYF
jgi:hypothetical protein